MERERPPDMREFYKERLAVHFGHFAEEDILRAMQLVRNACRENTKVKELAEQLREKMLIGFTAVFPEEPEALKELKTGQLTVLTMNYIYNQEDWNSRLDVWEKRNGR